MKSCDPRAWSSIIRNHSLDAKHELVISLFLQKVRWPFAFSPDQTILADVFKASSALLACNLGRTLHSFAIKLGHLSCLSVSKGLLNFYAKSGAFDECEKLFCQIPDPDAVVWNIVLSGLSGSQRHDSEVTRLFYSMHTHNDPEPSPITVAVILPVCARLLNLKAGKMMHSYAVKTGIESNTLVGNALTSMYAKCGLVRNDDYGAFTEIRDKDVVSWNAIIAGFSENGLKRGAYMLFRDMLQGPIQPNYATVVSILPVCATMDGDVAALLVREFHAYILRHPELQTNTSVSNALLSFYLRIGQAKEAESLFHGMVSRDVISWNAIIAGYALNKDWMKALRLFHELVSVKTVEIDFVTLVSILPSCTALRNLQLGKQIHSYAIHRPWLRDSVAVSNALISFYANCGDIESSYSTFLMASERDLISWNAMLDAFAVNGCSLELAALLYQMREEDLRPDAITMLLLLRFYGSHSSVFKVKEAHGYLLRACILHRDVDPTLVTALLHAYGKCGKVDYAFRIFAGISGNECTDLFKDMPRADLIAWNLMIHVFAENDCPDEAIYPFHQFQDQGLKPDAMSVMSILPVCSKLASVHLVRQCHAYVVRAGHEDVHLKGALIDIYAKCGSIAYARKLFRSSLDKDLVMFTAMVSGYAMNGMGEDALGVFFDMLQLGLRPDEVTITAVLSACSHAGLLDEGLRIFHSIEKIHGLMPTTEQRACIVDLLGRKGRVRDAYNFVNEMPKEASAKIWSTLLGACITYNETELGQVVAERLLDTEAKDIGSYVSVSNLYASDARWDGVLKIREQMETKYLKKPAGYAQLGCSRWERESLFLMIVVIQIGRCRDDFYGLTS